ncbi:MAG: hypothetical protein ACJ789_06915 [Thermomicrobiales bacterium]
MQNEQDVLTTRGPEAARDPVAADRGPGRQIGLWFLVALVIVVIAALLYYRLS